MLFLYKSKKYIIKRNKKFIFFLLGTVAFAKAFNLATPIKLLTHYAKGTPSYKHLNSGCL